MSNGSKWGQMVYAHALSNYGRDGFDFIVECSTVAELDEETKNCRTAAGAIKLVRSRAKLMAEQRLNYGDY